jgi:hypothetical protein
MPNEIYHRSEWGNPKAEGFGDVYFDASATNKLYKHSDNYENSDGTDKILRDIPNKASIVLTPTAYSDGSLNTVIPPYQVLPEELVTNGNFDTDTDWTKGSGWSIANGKASRTAQSGSTACDQSISLIAGKKYKIVYTLTISAGSFNVRFSGTTNVNGLSRTTSGTYVDYLVAATGNNTFRLVGADGSFVGSIDNVSVKEVTEADFDFSRGSSATRVNEKGLIEEVASNIPRIDYTSGQGALLLEPQSTNLALNSNDLTNNTWAKQSATTSTSTVVNPEGTSGASLYTCNNYTGDNQFFRIPNGFYGNNVAYTYSVFVKYNSFQYCKLAFTSFNPPYDQSPYFAAVFDIVNGLVTATNSVGNPTNTNSSIVDYGNGWFRISISAALSPSSGSFNFEFNKSPNATPTFDDFGRINQTTTTDDKVYVYGGQLEQKSFATSYIPTSGSTVTRSADVAINSGNADLINSTEGVLYAEIASFETNTAAKFITISDGTFNNRASISLSAVFSFRVFLKVGGSSQVDINLNVSDVKDYNKIALSYKENDFKIYINGSLVHSDTSGSVWSSSTITKLSFSEIGSTPNAFNGKVKSVAVFKEALTDAELQALTT